MTLLAPAPTPPTRDAADRRRWWVLGVLGLAQLMVVLDATVVNIALPSAQHGLGFSTGDRQWIVTAYSLAFGSLLLLGGRLADLIGRKRTLLIGMAGFAVASAIGGAADGFLMLVGARAVQGAFGALLAPASLAQLTTTFTEPKERSKAFGIYGAIAGTGGAIGLILGGALTQFLDWRWCLYVNDVIAVVALILAVRLVPSTPRKRGVAVDWSGLFSIVIALVGIVYGFAEAYQRGWSNPLTLVCLGVGVVLIAVFVAIERSVRAPMLPLRVLADRARGASNLVMLLSGIGMFAVFLFLTYYVQQVLGFSPLLSGIAFLPMIAGLMLTSTVVTAKLLPRFGPRWLVSGGMALTAGGLVILARLGVSSGYAAGVVPGLVVSGLGMGLMFGSVMNAATHGTDPADAGVASALPNIGQQVGGSIGTALLNTLATSAAASYVRSHGASSTAARIASVHGADTAFWWAAAIFALGAILSASLFRSGPLPASDTEMLLAL